MTRAEADRGLESERIRISHDLFKNGFGGILLPGWRDERLSPADVVLLAIRGEPESVKTVRDALAFWETSVFPALQALLRRISTAYGFVTGAVWDQEVCKISAADATIRHLLSSDLTAGPATAEDQARAFWQACDEVGRFLVDLRKRSSEFFLRWDPTVVSREPGT